MVDAVTSVLDAERARFAAAWAFSEYRTASDPGRQLARFILMLRPRPGQSALDAGCGEGRLGLSLARSCGLRVLWSDVTGAGLHLDVPRASFLEVPLWEPIAGERLDYAVCCRAVECLPTEYVGAALLAILGCCRTAYFSICTMPDDQGYLTGTELRQTVRPFTWWRDRVGSVANVVDARDLCGETVIVARAGGE